MQELGELGQPFPLSIVRVISRPSVESASMHILLSLLPFILSLGLMILTVFLTNTAHLPEPLLATVPTNGFPYNYIAFTFPPSTHYVPLSLNSFVITQDYRLARVPRKIKGHAKICSSWASEPGILTKIIDTTKRPSCADHRQWDPTGKLLMWSKCAAKHHCNK